MYLIVAEMWESPVEVPFKLGIPQIYRRIRSRKRADEFGLNDFQSKAKQRVPSAFDSRPVRTWGSVITGKWALTMIIGKMVGLSPFLPSSNRSQSKSSIIGTRESLLHRWSISTVPVHTYPHLELISNPNHGSTVVGAGFVRDLMMS